MDDGLRMVLQKTSGVATGTCAVLINGGERSLVANLAAANTFTAAHLETADAKDAVAKAKIVYTSGFFLTVSVDSILNVCKSVVEDNKIYCLNLSAPFIVQFFGDQLATAMQFADFVFANESEAATYGEVKGLGSDLPTIALKIAALPKASGCRPRVVVFTQGADSTIVACCGKVTTFAVDALPKHQLVMPSSVVSCLSSSRARRSLSASVLVTSLLVRLFSALVALSLRSATLFKLVHLSVLIL